MRNVPSSTMARTRSKREFWFHPPIGNKNNSPDQQRTDSNQTTLCGNIHRGLGSKLEWIIPILKSTGKL